MNPASHGATRDNDWRDGFLFVGNQLALDFLNTRPLINGEPQELLPDFASLLRWFHAAGLLPGNAVYQLGSRSQNSKRAQLTLHRLIDLRETLREAVAEWEGGGLVPASMLSELNVLLQKHPMLQKIAWHKKSITTELWFDPHEPEDLFAPIVHSAAMLFANAERHRVRQCRNCVLHFLDTSKKGTRRWCSMQLCGNRLKVAAYARRQKRAH